jgi:hypothetical protein
MAECEPACTRPAGGRDGPATRRVSGRQLTGCCASAVALAALASCGAGVALWAAASAPAARGKSGGGFARAPGASLEKQYAAGGIERSLIISRIDQFRYADSNEDGFLSAQVRAARPARSHPPL